MTKKNIYIETSEVQIVCQYLWRTDNPKEIYPKIKAKGILENYFKKNIDDIPGWHLLLSLKGKNETNLAMLYDIAAEKENGRETYYAFFEYLEGSTLDKLIDQIRVVAGTKLHCFSLGSIFFK